MRFETTARGFALAKFHDRNGVECSIQQSSLATEDCIWLGATEIGLKEFVPYRKPSAWADVDTNGDGTPGSRAFIANNRMHLTREQVRDLLPVLQHFVATGEIAPRAGREVKP